MSSGENGRLLAVVNPACSQREMADTVIGWLQESRWAGSLETVYTEPPEGDSNIRLIQSALEPGTIVLPLAGDGTDHDTFNAMVRASEAGEVGADEVSMLSVPTGSGNDLSRSLYERNILRRRGRRLWELLERGETAWIDAMKLDADGGQLDRYVHGYIGLGFTARAAAAINEPDFRARRAATRLPKRLVDGVQVLKALGGEPFEYADGSGETRQARELTFAIIPRIAAGVIRLDTDPFDRQLVGVEIGRRGFVPKAAAKVVSGMLGGISTEALAEGTHELTFRTPAPIQYDGEPDELEAGTVLTISHRPEIAKVLV